MIVNTAALESGIAKIGNVVYETLEEAVSEVENGDTITLLKDIELDPTYAIDRTSNNPQRDELCYPLINIDKDIVLDLNGKTISWNTEADNFDKIWYCPMFFQFYNADITIVGNGYIDTACGNHKSLVAILRGSRSVVNNGTYTGAPHAFLVEGGRLTVNGGTFIKANTCDTIQIYENQHVVDCVDGAFDAGTARVYINGGTFCFNPMDEPEGENTTYLNTEHYSIPVMWEVS